MLVALNFVSEAKFKGVRAPGFSQTHEKRVSKMLVGASHGLARTGLSIKEFSFHCFIISDARLKEGGWGINLSTECVEYNDIKRTNTGHATWKIAY